MVPASAAPALTSTPSEELIAWAEAHIAEAREDIQALKTSVRIWYHRKDREPVDVTETEIARLERRIRRLERFVERRREPSDFGLARTG